MTSREALAVAAILAPLLLGVVLLVLPRRWAVTTALAGAFGCAAVALSAAAAALTDPRQSLVGNWVILDPAGGLMVGVIGAVGLVSVLASPSYLDSNRAALLGHRRREATYFGVLYLFWGVLVAVPLAGNLGVAWLLVEATTAVSALLVGFSGKPRALEAGWKYLILTSLGLGIALFGIAVLAAGVPGAGLGALSWRALSGYAANPQVALIAYLLLMAGLAAKIGWAPVHNWLPDAHSEAPAPVSALLSAALLPAVLLVAWRSERSLAPVIGAGAARGVLIAFGLASIAVAVPFLARPQPWKRLLAYSSLEHMGVIALGIGFAHPIALAGVAIHVVGHAIAKTIGFCAATPLLVHEPTAGTQAVTGLGRSRPTLAVAVGLCLGSLAGLPPSPLFASELLIVVGGFAAGQTWPAVAALALLALAFLGLIHALIETTAGETSRERGVRPAGLRGVAALTAVGAVLLLVLAGTALWLPSSDVVLAMVRGEL
ncbi:MAG: proton-conducting transporter membrane subunit [Micromonosporaceae bacterium]